MLALIDGDIVTFRAAASAEGEAEAWIATSRANEVIENIISETGTDSYEVWLSGDNNFRYQVYPEYKANRIGMPRPKWENDVKAFLKLEWNAMLSNGCEADDMLGVRQCENTNNSVICTIDKDLWQIPGPKYNFVKKEHSSVGYLDGIRYFYYQMLVGDTADNIKGVPGIGPKKAEKLLSQGSTEKEWFNIVRDTFSNDEFMEQTGKCLWIWRSLGDIWRMPIDTAEREGQRTEIATDST
jgi:5'-3' exonuclease